MTEIKHITVALSRKNLQLCTLALRVNWRCPRCGEARGEVMKTKMPINRQILVVNFWVNPCGHHDAYRAMVSEAAANDLNHDLKPLLTRYLNKGFVENTYWLKALFTESVWLSRLKALIKIRK